jgi:hypothetical protein
MKTVKFSVEHLQSESGSIDEGSEKIKVMNEDQPLSLEEIRNPDMQMEGIQEVFKDDEEDSENKEKLDYIIYDQEESLSQNFESLSSPTIERN